MSRQFVLRAVLAAAVVASAGPTPAPVRAENKRESRRADASGMQLVTPKTQRAIDLGLARLAARQHDDGSFGSGSGYLRNVAVTSLCGMAFLSAGHTPGRGKYGRNVTKAVDFILSAAKPNGFINVPDSESHGPMYGHGFATLFLAEIYGMDPRPEIRDALDRAVKLIVNTQNKEGGWRYNPVPQEADISVTVCQMMALRAARNCGLMVPKETVDRCVEYVKNCQNADGGFRYQLGRRAESLFPRSAAAVVALYNAGIHEGREVERGLDYLARFRPHGETFFYESHYFYGHYYAVQAMWYSGGSHWQMWYPAIRDELLRRQLPDGTWADTTICNEYGTAMACIVLQMPNNYLPIFQR